MCTLTSMLVESTLFLRCIVKNMSQREVLSAFYAYMFIHQRWGPLDRYSTVTAAGTSVTELQLLAHLYV